ncbi:hypothetical protein ACFZA2_09495 [Microbacterium sp. NPDC007973]|uniref:hypothetical protein n=1 Tax=Microbacterium sp. NPDC007973 TaxID=3364182 RepID=UPI0036E5C15A
MRRRPRTAVALAATGLLMLCLALLTIVIAVGARGDGRTEVVVGSWDADAILSVAGPASALLLLVVLCAIRAPRWWLLLFVPLRLAAGVVLLGALLLAAFTTGGTVVPLVVDGCRSGYVVSERRPWDETDVRVLRVDGLTGTLVASGTARDGGHPFADGDYRVVSDGENLRVRSSRLTGPTFVLPVLAGPVSGSCGLPDGQAPLPTPTAEPAARQSEEGPAPAPLLGDTRAEVARMVQVTLDAATAPVRDADGAFVEAPAASDLPCDGTTGIALVFATGDNSASYASILAAWDAEGFSADRAMQEDLRDNGVVRLAARDRSTIDGLLHLSLTAPCRAS